MKIIIRDLKFLTVLSILTVQFILINLIFFGNLYFLFIFHVGTFQKSGNAIFPFTWGAALITFILAILSTYRKAGIIPAIVIGISASFAGTSLFEDIYQSLLNPIFFHEGILAHILNWSAVLWGFSGYRFWNKKILLFMLPAYFILWGIWWGIGYPQIYLGIPLLNNPGYYLNVILKIMSFMIFILLLIVPGRKIKTLDNV